MAENVVYYAAVHFQLGNRNVDHQHRKYFSVDLDRIILMYNPSVYETADVIQSYVYRIAFQSTGFPDYSYGTAVNMLKSVIAFILVIIANKLAARYSETRLF